MKNIPRKFSIFFFTWLFIPFHASTSDSNFENKRVILKGEISKSSITQVSQNVELHPDLNELELRDSIGTRGFAGLAVDDIENRFRTKHLKTFARGECASTCAYIFLLGETKTFLPSLSNSPTHIMIHAFRHNQTREVDYGLTDANFKRIVKNSRGKFPIKLLEKIYDDINANGDGELYIFRDIFTTKRGKSHALVCKNSKFENLNECEPIIGVTPQRLGILIAQ